MKKALPRYILIAIVLVVALSLVLGGCTAIEFSAADGANTSSSSQNSSGSTASNAVVTTDTTRSVVTYVSTSSTTYSSTAEVVAAVADTVVEISTETVTTQWGRQYIASGAGSGVIVGVAEHTYYIITNHHVIEGANEITVRTRAGVSYEGALVATDDSADIAVVTITTEDVLSIAVLGNSDDLQIGEDLIAIGNPLGNLGGTVTKGILSAKGRTIEINNYAMTLLQTDTAINPGNSGGGLFNMKGELIGVVNAKTSDEEIEGICFAIPINVAKYVYDSLVEHGYLMGRATFNVNTAVGTLSGMMGGQSATIVYVTSVSDASATGFQQYDRIYKINGTEITSLLDYNVALSKISAGDTVQVEVYRGSQSYWGISFANETTTFSTTALQYGA